MPDTVDYFANEAEVPTSTLVELFFDTVDRLGDAHAYGGAVDLTYRAVESIVARGVAALGAMGIERGDRVAILSENRVEWALADWMCLCAGAVDVPIYSTLPAAQVAYILADSGSSLIFVSDEEQYEKAKEAATGLDEALRIVRFEGTGSDTDSTTSWRAFLERGDPPRTDDVRAAARRAEPEDVATMIYTSGTTGTPKGVMLTHGNLASNVWAAGHALKVDPTDSTLSFLPLSHVFQRMVDYLFFSSGCTITHGEVATVAPDLKRIRPTKVVSVPRLYEKVYQTVLDAGGFKGRLVAWAASVGRKMAQVRESGGEAPTGLRIRYAVADRLVFRKLREGVGGRIRYFVSGGAPLSPEIARFFYGAGITILEGYGLTETSPVTNVNTLEDLRIGTVGRPVPGTEIRIADDGEILIRGPQVMKGYYGMEDKTREVISDDGWFSTGDIGELSTDGYLTITDRKKDLIKTSGGKYVAPQGIENRLKGNPYIDQAVVVGEGRNFCSVLVVPAFERLRAWAREQGKEHGDDRTLLEEPAVQALLTDEIFGELRDLARFETPKKIGLLTEPFTIENGALTPTQKVKRPVVVERYASMIDEFYRSDRLDQTIFLPAA